MLNFIMLNQAWLSTLLLTQISNSYELSFARSGILIMHTDIWYSHKFGIYMSTVVLSKIEMKPCLS